MTPSHECIVLIRYQPGSSDGWPWTVTHESSRRVLTITDRDDSSICVILRALALGGKEIMVRSSGSR